MHPPIDPERGEGVSCPLQAPPAELAEGRRGPRVAWGHARAVRDSRRETQGVRLRYRSRRHSRHPPSPVLSWLLTSDRPLTVGAAAYHMHLVRVRCAWAHARAHSTQASAHATAHARARAHTHTHTHTQIIKTAFTMVHLIYFFTAGPDEARTFISSIKIVILKLLLFAII